MLKQEEKPIELEKLWYGRVRHWCRRNKISVRKFNKFTRNAEKEELIDARVMGSLKMIERAVGLKNVELADFVSFDETSLFAAF